ncbi:hypothetical protein [Amycolatopsis sp. cmx-11-12]|uniref:hypothetical protein n=1 Tax=Amycolatopsis sp. cmx-11-12 TaxID=2785795 RepID=UPI00391832CA
MKIRKAILLTAAAVMASALAPTVAQADERAETCQTYTKRYFLGSGSTITLRVAYVDAALKLCFDDAGVSSAVPTQTVGTTGPGAASGWEITAGPAIVEDQRPRHVKAKYSGSLRNCIVQINPICSPAAPYEIYAEYAPPEIGPAAPFFTHGPDGDVHYYEDA